VTLATLWASKEAAYKSLMKTTNCRFVPKRFAVRFGNPNRLTGTESAMVAHDGILMRVELSLGEHWVHAIALSPVVQVVRWTIREITRCFREDCQAQDESEAVRFLAAELVSRYCQEDVRLDFQGRIPILALKGGGRTAIDVSFSHHGKFAAVAVAWPMVDNWQIKSDRRLSGNASAREETCSTYTA
jgi:hypothetical protein